MLKKLINKGADVQIEDANGETPLQIAEDEEYQEIEKNS